LKYEPTLGNGRQIIKQLFKRPNIKVIFSLLLVIVIALVLIIKSSVASSQYQITSPILPSLPTNNFTDGNTSTPNSTDISIYSTTNAQFPHPTPTALVISKTADLSPELPEDDKYAIVVAHPDETNEKFTIGPVSFSTNHPTMAGTITPDIITRLNLKKGDTILLSYSIKEMKSIILAPTSIPIIRIISTSEILTTPIPTTLSYPLPVPESPPPYPSPQTLFPTQTKITSLISSPTPILRDVKDVHIISPTEIAARETEDFEKPRLSTLTPLDLSTPVVPRFPVNSISDLPNVVYNDPFYGSDQTGFGPCILSKNPGTPVLIQTSGNIPNYYIIPFFRDNKICGQALIRVTDGFGSVFALGEARGDKFPQISADDAINLVHLKTGKQIIDKPILVFIQSYETPSPDSPFWKVITTDGQVYYVVFFAGQTEDTTSITVLSANEIHWLK
jgi:hypothetical protein